MKRKGLTRFIGITVVLGAALLLFGMGLSRAQSSGGVLDLTDPGIQLMSYYRSLNVGRWVNQTVFDQTAGYSVRWQSGLLPGMSASIPGAASVRIGDIDSDGKREVVVSTYYQTRVVSSKGTRTEYYNFRILIYEEGCAYGGDPDSQSLPLGEMANTILNDSFIADAKNIGRNQLVLLRSGEVDICDPNNSWAVEKVGNISRYNWSLDVGDADNDGRNEIVASCSQTASPVVIFKYAGGVWNRTDLAVPPQYNGGQTIQTIRYAKVRNADNLNPGTGRHENEIVACGLGRFLVWKWNGSQYVLTAGDFVGDIPTLATDAGDINGDGSNEVLLTIGKSGKKASDGILVYSYDWTAGKYVLSGNYPVQPVAWDLALGDLNHDGKAETAVASYPSGLQLLGYTGAGFLSVYSDPRPDVACRLEIR